MPDLSEMTVTDLIYLMATAVRYSQSGLYDSCIEELERRGVMGENDNAHTVMCEDCGESLNDHYTCGANGCPCQLHSSGTLPEPGKMM